MPAVRRSRLLLALFCWPLPALAQAPAPPRRMDVELMLALTHDDAGLNESFGVYIVDWFLHRVYDELDGRLTDSIAPIPQQEGAAGARPRHSTCRSQIFRKWYP